MRKNFSPWAIHSCQNENFISSPLSGKNTITFCNIWDNFTRRHGGVTSQRGRIKIWQMLLHPHDSWSTSCKKLLFQIFSSFAATYHKGHFRKILTQIFKFGTIPISFKNLNYSTRCRIQCWIDWHQFQIPKMKNQKACMPFPNHYFSF